MKSPAKPASKNDDPFDGDDSHCMIGYGYAGIAPPRPDGPKKAAKPPVRAARAGSRKVGTSTKAPAPLHSKNDDPFDGDDSRCMIGYRYQGLLRFQPRRRKKAAKRSVRAATAR